MQDTFTTTKTKLGRTKPSTGPHAAGGLDIAGLSVLNVRTAGHMRIEYPQIRQIYAARGAILSLPYNEAHGTVNLSRSVIKAFWSFVVCLDHLMYVL